MLFQEVYVQLFLDSLCPDKTLILNMVKLTNTLLGQHLHVPIREGHSAVRSAILLCDLLLKGIRLLRPSCVTFCTDSRPITRGVTEAATSVLF